LHHTNEQQIQSTTPSVDIASQNQVPVSVQNDVTSPFTPVQTQVAQQPILSVSDTIKTIPISNDKSNLNDAQPSAQAQINPKPVETIQQNRLKEENSFTHTESHIPSPSNSNPLDLKSDQHSQIPLKQTQTTTSEPSIVQNESQPPRIVRSSPPRYHQQAQIHPRHIQINQQQTEDISATGTNFREKFIEYLESNSFFIRC